MLAAGKGTLSGLGRKETCSDVRRESFANNVFQIYVGTGKQLLSVQCDKKHIMLNATISTSKRGSALNGFDTSAMTASAVMLMLAIYPDIQEKARREAEEVLGDRDASLEDINRLIYLEAVTKETLRLFGPPLFLRKIKGDVPLDNCTLVEGCTTVVFVYDIHKSTKFWDSPDDFMPERFIGTTLKHRYCYLPFSSGPRNCPGQRFANMSMRLLLANVLRNYKLTTHVTDWSQVKMKLDVLQTPVDGYPIKLEPLR
uniref:Cytochrome P450 CYP426A1 n=1 Tax=Nilaparvata lugens TaxID=108931 RepID=A0A0K0LBD7_NILLU|nr:cytochrome P450 CYP426A1 [Nilaparvata lugens]